MARLAILMVLTFLLNACIQENQPIAARESNSQQIISKVIQVAGGDRYENAAISFDFRGVTYVSKRKEGQYELSRIQTDTVGNTIHDKLTNNRFTRSINDSIISLPDSLTNAYSNSVNSVHYFAQLPNGLAAGAVISELIDTVTIGENEYYKIEINFKQEGGGDDHEDTFLYWFDTDDYTMDFLAYKYHTDGGGMRFREAFNIRNVGGIRFADYRNMVPKQNAIDENLFYQLDSLYQSGQLEVLSLIELENVEVRESPTMESNSK